MGAAVSGRAEEKEAATAGAVAAVGGLGAPCAEGLGLSAGAERRACFYFT